MVSTLLSAAALAAPFMADALVLFGVSMRRHILSRANVVASEATRSNQRPLALRFHPHSVWAGYEWPGALWDPSGAALPFEVRPPANSGGHTPSRSRREQAWGVLGLPSSPFLPEPSGPRDAEGSGYLLVPAMARVVQRFVDLCRHP